MRKLGITPARRLSRIDPRDDAQLEAALRSALTDAGLLARLRAEARAYRPKQWTAYADELWEALMDQATGR